MAKNINIETTNGTMTLTGTKNVSVYAQGGNLIVNLGTETKTYPLSSILGYTIGNAARKGGKGDILAAAIVDAEGLVAVRLASLRRNVGDIDDVVIEAACELCAALDAVATAKHKMEKFAEFMSADAKAERKAKLAAKKRADANVAAAEIEAMAAAAAAASAPAPAAKRTKKSA